MFRRCAREQFFVIYLVADHCVGTNHDAFTALDTDVLIPDGDFQGNVALFPLCCAGGEGAVHGESRDWDIVTVGTDDLSKHIADKFRRFTRDREPARRL
jgi:hypothetical protein